MKKCDSYIDFLEKNIIWLFAIAAVLLFIRLGAAPIYILDEAKNAQCAREMLESGNLVVPTFNGELRTDKPALHYWFMAFAYSVFGVGAWQARFFSGVMGLLILALTFLFVQKHLGRRPAFVTTLLLVLSAHFMFEYRLSVPDPYLITFTGAGLFAAFNYLGSRSFKWLMVSAACLALATLAKGPVAIGLPGLAIVLYAGIEKKWWLFKDFRLIAAALLYAAIAFPWFWLVHQQTDGAFTQGFFFEHNLNRFSGEMEGHGGPIFLPLLFVIMGFLPFSLNVGGIVKRTGWRKVNPLIRYSIIIAAVYIVFFAFSSTKLPNYPMPCYPFVAIIIAHVLLTYDHINRPWPLYAIILLAVIALALPVGGWFVLQNEAALAPYSWLSIGLIIMLLPALLLFREQNRFVPPMLSWLTLGFILFNIYFLAVAYPQVYRQNPVSVFKEKMDGDFRWIVYKQYNPALNFNLANKNEYFETAGTPEQLNQLMHQQNDERPALIITRRDHAGDLSALGYEEVFAARDLFELPETVVLKKNNQAKN